MFDEMAIEVEFAFQVVISWRRKACRDGDEKQRTGGGDIRSVPLGNRC
jgi:hypothetical protein